MGCCCIKWKKLLKKFALAEITLLVEEFNSRIIPTSQLNGVTQLLEMSAQIRQEIARIIFLVKSNPDEIEKIKLEDAISIHEDTKDRKSVV